MTDDLAPLLKGLPEPAPPSTITATVMARIAREAERRAEVPVAAPSARRADLAAWLYTFAGVAVVLTVCAYGWISTQSMPDLTSARIGRGRPTLIPVQGSLIAVLGLGLLFYVAGLFAPLRTVGRE